MVSLCDGMMVKVNFGVIFLFCSQVLNSKGLKENAEYETILV